MMMVDGEEEQYQQQYTEDDDVLRWFTTDALFIARVEAWQSDAFIADIFYRHNIGIVSEIQFAEKTNGAKSYYTAIVFFKQWFESDATKRLFVDMSNAMQNKLQTKTDTARFYFNERSYWNMKFHTPKYVPPEHKHPCFVDETLSEHQQINHLLRLVETMRVQMFANELKQEQCEQQLMYQEQRMTQQHLEHIERGVQFDSLAAEANELCDMYESASTELCRANETIAQLTLELKSQNCLVEFLANATKQMWGLLKEVRLPVDDPVMKGIRQVMEMRFVVDEEEDEERKEEKEEEDKEEEEKEEGEV